MKYTSDLRTQVDFYFLGEYHYSAESLIIVIQGVSFVGHDLSKL